MYPEIKRVEGEILYVDTDGIYIKNSDESKTKILRIEARGNGKRRFLKKLKEIYKRKKDGLD